MSFIINVITGLASGVADLFLLPWHVWQWLQLETLKERMGVLVLAGQSLEFLHMMLALVVLMVLAGLFSRRILRASVLGLEGVNRTLGHTAAWFTLLLMLQQVLIIMMGQVFRGNELQFAPFGILLFSEELQWLSGQLKFYNAILIAFASAYTFIEGGHVRVDLVYGNLGARARQWIDLIGSIVFMLPTTILLWWFAWPIVTNALFSQRPMNIFSDKASWRNLKLESSGTAEFTWVWAFKVLILVFAALLFLQALAFLLRNLWALREPPGRVPTHPRSEPEAAPVYEAGPDIDLGGPPSGRPAQGRPAQGRPAQGRPAQGRPAQGRPVSQRPTPASDVIHASVISDSPREVQAVLLPAASGAADFTDLDLGLPPRNPLGPVSPG